MSTIKRIDKDRKPVSRELAPIEASCLEMVRVPGVAPADLPAEWHSRLAQGRRAPSYEAELAEKNLLAPRGDERRWLSGCGRSALAIIIVLGLYKLGVGIAKGHTNVLFLCVMGPVGGLAFSAACWFLPRLSHLGKAHLERLKLAYSGLKGQVHPIGSATSDLTMADDPGARGKAAIRLGVFGLPADGGHLRGRLAGRHTAG